MLTYDNNYSLCILLTAAITLVTKPYKLNKNQLKLQCLELATSPAAFKVCAAFSRYTEAKTFTPFIDASLITWRRKFQSVTAD